MKKLLNDMIFDMEKMKQAEEIKWAGKKMQLVQAGEKVRKIHLNCLKE